MPGPKNMFAAFADDSDTGDEPKGSQAKKTASKDTKKKQGPDETKEMVGTRRAEEGDYESYGDRRGRATRARGRGRGERGRGRGDRGRGDRGRGDRSRGRGNRARGDRGKGRGRGDFGGYEGNFKEDRGGYRGDRRGRGRGFAGRGGRYAGPRDTYSKLASKEELGIQEENQPGQQDFGAEGHRRPHREYERRSGTGMGRDVKKGGAGKANWGSPEYEGKRYEHLEAEDAAEIAEQPAGEEETKKEETVEEQPPQEEEEEVNNLTYAEYIAQKKQEQSAGLKGESRKPEELKVKNIQKYNKDDKHKKTITSNIKAHEAYAPGGISADVEVGFKPVGDEVEEDFYPRGGRGRGRGRGRGAPRGGYRGDDREQDRGGRGRQGRGGKKFVAQDDDFPPL